MFTQEGSFNAVIKEAFPAQPPEWRAKDAGPNDFDICLLLERQDNADERDYWRGEWSENYSKQKNKEYMRQREVLMESLHSIGFDGDDLSTLEEQLVGKVIPVTVKAGKMNDKGKQYMNVYLGSYGPVAIDKEEMKRRMSAMFGSGADAAASGTRSGASSAPASAPATLAKATNSDPLSPFVKCSKCGKAPARVSTKLCAKCE